MTAEPPSVRAGTRHVSTGRVQYWETGDAVDPVTVLLHGMCGTHADMRPLAHFLQRQQPGRLVLLDLPGHGTSDPLPSPPDVPGIARVVAEVLGQLRTSETRVVGHSLGAAVATALGAHHPELVSRLVLLDPGMVLPGRTRSRLRTLYDSAETDGFAAMIDRVFRPMLFTDNDPPDFANALLQRMTDAGVEQFRAVGHAVLGFDGLPAVRAVTNPTLLISTDTGLADTDRIRRANPAWNLRHDGGTSHAGLLVQPGTHRAVAQFLRSGGIR